MQDNNLSNVEYWSENIENLTLPREYDLDEYNIYRFNKLFNRVLPKNLNGSVLEIGCAASAWLPYFLKNFNLNPTGIDYSEIGCKLAAENLKIIFSQDFSKKIICRDIFEERQKDHQLADLVFTYGLIEHFKNTDSILEEVGSYVKDEGFIITIVPNLQGIMGMVTKLLMPKIYDTHLKIEPGELGVSHQKIGFKELYCGYFGSIYLKVVPWENGNFRFKKFVLLSVNYLEKINSFMFKVLHIEIESKTFSPYVVYIGKKEIAEH